MNRRAEKKNMQAPKERVDQLINLFQKKDFTKVIKEAHDGLKFENNFRLAVALRVRRQECACEDAVLLDDCPNQYWKSPDSQFC